MIRPATPEDRPTIAALIARAPQHAMFMAVEHARGRGGFWLSGDPPSGVVQLSSQDFFLTLAPGLSDDDWATLRHRLRGRPCHGVNGRPDCVAPALAGLGIDRHPATLDRVEPLFTLDLSTLVLPEGTSTLRPLTGDDLPALVPWRAAYLNETMADILGDRAARAAEGQLRRLIAEDNARVLEEDGVPVAICAFNAVLPDRVQVGGVYTPPALRGRGHARRAVALHLAEARDRGTTSAVLFAASARAAHAYGAIGFRPAGDYRLVFHADPVLLGS
ncbi:GNAT family N-acetyltransferase [Acidimangrovimonas sediminis]|uniref:GNAT family N-acetyltransferase n=1 Tax=Acidimangrovimonas sediminis TaxID=2056283 RepID=UPI000C804B81|nr:GNAT family N-acetyltransferase [Acidimangrovimonas sediminis]